MFDANAHIPRINKGTIYLGACLIAGMRFASFPCAPCGPTESGTKVREVPQIDGALYVLKTIGFRNDTGIGFLFPPRITVQKLLAQVN